MKKSLLFLLMCLFATFLSAQTSFHAEDLYTSGGDAPIVRSWDRGNAAITYFEVGLKKYVQYTNYLTGDSYRSEIPYHMQIYDMYILGDTVYYCGYSVLDSAGPGIIGYFDPREMYVSSNLNFHTLPVRPLSHVYKLVAQRNASGGGVEVIGIGEHQWTDTIHEGGNIINIPHLVRHFVFCHDILQNPVDYDTIEIPLNEHYFNVLLTTNYVVFVGLADYFSYSMICLRIRKRIESYPYPTLDYFHVFPTGANEIFSAMHSTAMEGDNIATSYMHIDVATGDVSNRVRVIDVGQMLMLNSQEYIVSDKSEVGDIVYIPDDKSLVCMHDFLTPLNNFNTNFVYLNPAAVGNYPTLIEYLKETFFKSLTNKRQRHYLASLGPNWFLKDKAATGSYSDPSCPEKEGIDIHVLDNVTERPFYNPTNIFLIRMVKYIEGEPTERRTTSIICKNL
ncbi:MAG: hypothetical protein IKR33_00835 [Bacteroidales bacterium]|nr:hypothetical protein [Bacteroidales bacterium]